MCARILVIDDDPINLDLMIYLLKAFNHTPLPAQSATSGLEIIRSDAADLILCDIQMPDVDGFEFLRRLTAEGRRGVPVVGVTALAMVGDREKVLAAGFDGYMAKPITPETFVQDVERYLKEIHRSDPSAGREPHPPAADSPPPGKAPNNMTILLVDDEKSNLEILRLLLSYEGYDVLIANSAKSAIPIARSRRPDAVVSDLHMPDGDGFELLDALRGEESLRTTPVILVSATSPRNQEVQKAMRLGVAKFLLRPFEPEVLLDALSDCFSKAKDGRA